MKAKRSSPAKILAALREGKYLYIKAGAQPHRFIAIWVVVVKERVYVRSWSVKAQGWYRTFLKEPRGAIQVAGREIPVRTRGERVKDEIDRAYLEKYNTSARRPRMREVQSDDSRAATVLVFSPAAFVR